MQVSNFIIKTCLTSETCTRDPSAKIPTKPSHPPGNSTIKHYWTRLKARLSKNRKLSEGGFWDTLESLSLTKTVTSRPGLKAISGVSSLLMRLFYMESTTCPLRGLRTTSKDSSPRLAGSMSHIFSSNSPASKMLSKPCHKKISKT